jgi:hypothetical protein
MDRTDPSLRPAAADDMVWLPPSIMILDGHDVGHRVRNYRASVNACPSAWKRYFELLIEEIERDMQSPTG